jgi:hypothetical protein
LVSFNPTRATPSGIFYIAGVGKPELIARTSAITYVWEVKSAADQLTPRPGKPDGYGVANANQITRYVLGLANSGNFTNVQRGPDIVPASTTAPDGNVITIFSADNWGAFSFENARKAENPSGIIYYRKFYRPRATPSPTISGNSSGEAEAEDDTDIGEPATATAPTTSTVPRDGVVAVPWYEDVAFWGGFVLGAALCLVACGAVITFIGGKILVRQVTRWLASQPIPVPW